METKYYKGITASLERFLLQSEGLQIAFWKDYAELEIRDNLMSEELRKGFGYTEITREEFMKAYLPVNEKINSKVAEI